MENSFTAFTTGHRVVFFLLAFLVLGVVWFGVVHAFTRYRVGMYEKRLETTTAELQKQIANDRAAAVEDSLGGATPAETILLYIKALEAGDDVRASSYFVDTKQTVMRERFERFSPDARKEVLKLSREAAAREGVFSVDAQSYVIDEPLLFRLIRYPNGVWKIVEW